MDANFDTVTSIQRLIKAQEQRIERLVFSGGGAKGVVYPGAYKAMVETGLFQGVKSTAGSSAGAIIATLTAVGIKPAILREKILTTNFKQMLGKVVHDKSPGVTILTKDGLPLETFIRESIIETAREALAKLHHLASIKEQNPDLKQLVDKIAEDNPCITFADLALLHSHFPTEFKDLIITAVKYPNGELQIFNSEQTPEVEVALACRASASLPVLLKPVEIQINGITERFIDGGLFDNLPTDYFDIDEHAHLDANKKHFNTLIFAFGEGLNNKRNQVFQALYGPRWDEVIADTLLHTLFTEIISLATVSLEDLDHTMKCKTNLLMQTAQLVLKKHIQDKQLNADESNAILSAMQATIKNLLLKPKNNTAFWLAYNNATQVEQIHLLGTYIKEQMKPILYKVSFIDELKRNFLVRVFGKLQTPYKNTVRKELGFQKIRSEYTLRTVELRVGNIKTTDFNKAQKEARVMDALGYLDTVNHITNHELHNPTVFNAEQFYIDLVNRFLHIHQAVLLGSGENPHQNSLIQKINTLRTQLAKRTDSQALISRQIYQLIKEGVDNSPGSVAAFALSRAVEFTNATISADELFKETYEQGFQRSGFFALSNITGEKILASSTLHQRLKDTSMFELYKKRGPSEHNKRTDKVFHSLSKIESFSRAFSQESCAERPNLEISLV